MFIHQLFFFDFVSVRLNEYLVSVVTGMWGWVTEESWFDYQNGQDILLLFLVIQTGWEADHSRPSNAAIKNGAIPLLPLYARMVCTGTGTITFLLKCVFIEGPRSRRYGRTAALRLIVQPCDGAPVE
jgi:hypothetical protein